jgi:AraC-like DNA-binding protein
MMPWVKWRPTNGSSVLKNGRISTDGDDYSGRLSTSRSEPLIAQVKNIIRGNRRLTIRKVAKEVGISTGSCHTIFTEYLGMHLVSEKCVPRLLTDDHKLQRFSICENSSKCHYRWRHVGLRLWRWNQTTILTLEEPCFDSPQQNLTGALASESNAACYFRSSRHCALWIRSWRSDN